MGVTVPDPDEVSSELVKAVCEGTSSSTEVEVRPTGHGRPGILRVTNGLLHTNDLSGFEVVGVNHSQRHTTVHVAEE